MPRYRVECLVDERPGGVPASLTAPDIATALIVADIAFTGRASSLWEGDRRLARLDHHGASGAPYWRVG